MIGYCSQVTVSSGSDVDGCRQFIFTPIKSKLNVMHLNHTLSKSLTIEFLILIFSNSIRQRCFSSNGPFLLGRLFSFEVLYVKATWSTCLLQDSRIDSFSVFATERTQKCKKNYCCLLLSVNMWLPSTQIVFHENIHISRINFL